MAESIIVAIITGVLTLIGVLISNSKFAKRMPVVEEQIKVINHRISDLEDDMKNHHH